MKQVPTTVSRRKLDVADSAAVASASLAPLSRRTFALQAPAAAIVAKTVGAGSLLGLMSSEAQAVETIIKVPDLSRFSSPAAPKASVDEFRRVVDAADAALTKRSYPLKTVAELSDEENAELAAIRASKSSYHYHDFNAWYLTSYESYSKNACALAMATTLAWSLGPPYDTNPKFTEMFTAARNDINFLIKVTSRFSKEHEDYLRKAYQIYVDPLQAEYLYPKPYTSNDYYAWIDLYCIEPDINQLNDIRQHRPHIYSRCLLGFRRGMDPYFAHGLNSGLFEAEKYHDRRLKKESVDDSVEEVKNMLGYPTGEIRIKIGNLRKPVEQGELDNTRNWIMTAIRGPLYSDDSRAQACEPTEDQESDGYLNSDDWFNRQRFTSVAKALGNVQNNTLYYLASKDVKKNGIPVATSPEKWQLSFRSLTQVGERKSGTTYPPYLATQLFLRAVGQFSVASTRLALGNRWIDLGLLVSGLTSANDHSGGIANHIGDPVSNHQGRLAFAIAQISGVSIAGCIFAQFAVTDAWNEIVKDPSATNDTIIKGVIKRMRGRLNGTIVTAGTLNALGILGVAAFAIPDDMRRNAQFWVKGGFAGSDLIGGISEIVTAIRSGKPVDDPYVISACSSGTFRIAGAVYSLSTYIRYFDAWTIAKSWSGRPAAKALNINTVTATLSAMACIVGAVIVHLD